MKNFNYFYGRKTAFYRKFAAILAIIVIVSFPIHHQVKSFSEDYSDGVYPPSRYEGHGWFYNLKEMEEVYESEYQSPEKILKNVVYREGEKWIGVVEEEKFEVPQEFIDRTLELFQELLEKKTAKYLFRLDAFHGHLFVSEKKFDEEYLKLSTVEQARKLVWDKDLGVLFHNSEHLNLLVEGVSTPEEKALINRRNVIGWYNGRPLEIFPLPKGGKIFGISASGRELFPYPKFAAHKDGVFSITVNGREIRLDISFDDPTYY